MTCKKYSICRYFLLPVALFAMVAIATACTVQLASKNRNTDCGFTNDRVFPKGNKDPAIFYGNHGNDQ